MGRRLRSLEAAVRARRHAADPIAPILILTPSAWGTAEERAYRAAVEAGDWVAEAEIIERNVGQRPAPPGDSRQICFIIAERPDGPQ